MYIDLKNCTTCSCDVYNEQVNEENGSRRLSGRIGIDEGYPTGNNERNEIHEMAEMWYTSVDEAEKTRISGVTTHNWIEDESITSSHQLLAPYDSNLEAILRKDVIIENRERKLKVLFAINLFENILTLHNADNIVRINYLLD